MKKIYCDCCGKEIIRGPKGNRATRVGRIYPILCHPGYGQMNERLDMCVDCDKAFVDFWNKMSCKQSHDSVINTILFDDANEALQVLNALEDLFCKYGYATEADFLSASGLLDDMEPDKIRMYDLYGWNESDINNGKVVKGTRKWHVELPPARKISDIVPLESKHVNRRIARCNSQK